MMGRCRPGRFIRQGRDGKLFSPSRPTSLIFTRGEKNLTVWPTFLERITRQTSPSAFPEEPQPQPWGSETPVCEAGTPASWS